MAAKSSSAYKFIKSFSPAAISTVINMAIQSIKFICAAIALIFTLPCFSQDMEFAQKYASIGYFTESEGDRGGLEISYTGFFENHFGIKLSGVLYNAVQDTETNSDDTGLFTGYSFSGMLHAGTYIKPFVGLGIFIGNEEFCHNNDSRRDSEREESNGEGCEDQNIIAFYPEAGIAFTLLSLQVTPFARRMYDSENVFSAYNAYGVSVGFKFR